MKPKHQEKTWNNIYHFVKEKWLDDYIQKNNLWICEPQMELFTCKFWATAVGGQLEPFAELNHGAVAESLVV